MPELNGPGIFYYSYCLILRQITSKVKYVSKLDIEIKFQFFDVSRRITVVVVFSYNLNFNNFLYQIVKSTNI